MKELIDKTQLLVFANHMYKEADIIFKQDTNEYTASLNEGIVRGIKRIIKLIERQPIMNTFRELNKQEEEEFRQWARDNYDPKTMDIKACWHPVVVDECAKIHNELFNNKGDG